MKARVLAGSRRPPTGRSGGSDAAAVEPEYRWTIKTWVKRTFWERDGYSYGGGKRAWQVEDERTMTVIASTEERAKAKVEAALPALPQDREGTYGPTEYARKWEFVGPVVEVES